MSLPIKTLVWSVVFALGLAADGQVKILAQSRSQDPVAWFRDSYFVSQRLPHDSVAQRETQIELLLVPHGGIQPQAVVDAAGSMHLIYFRGDDASAGDLYYVHRDAGAKLISEPIRINSRPGSACATGSVRGGQIALGLDSRPHVVWNGAGIDYARLNDAGTAFEDQRNLMRDSEIPDGGGTVAADGAGNVLVIWHGQAKGERGEDKRKVWVARSADEGQTFALETPAWNEPTGVCPCCSTRALFERRDGVVYLLYRSATAQVHRDTYLLFSQDLGRTFQQALVHPWQVPS